MIITRRINQISGVLDLNLDTQARTLFFHRELALPSVWLQCFALFGLVAAFFCAPPFKLELSGIFPACILGVLAGIIISYRSRSKLILNIGAFSTAAFASSGFHVLLMASQSEALWTLPIGTLIVVAVAVIISGPIMYVMLVAVVWMALDIDFNRLRLFDHGWWPQLLIGSAIIIGLLISIFLHRLRRINQQCILRLVDMAYKDHLTGIPNRRWFVEAVNLALERDQVSGHLLMLDIDNFKRVNDEAGHDVGDVVLRRVGAIIASEVAGMAHARLGGEEFAVVVRGDLRDADVIAGRLLRAVRTGLIAERIITVSIGAAALQGRTVSEAMRCADQALYRAKVSGKNRVEFHPEQAPAGSPNIPQTNLESETT